MQKPKTKNAAPRTAKRPSAKRRRKCAYSPDEVREIFRRFAVQRPEPQGELEHVNPFTLLVAVEVTTLFVLLVEV